MKRLLLLVLIALAAPASAQQTYYPPANAWETRTAQQAGFDAAKLKAAVDYALTVEAPTRTDSASIAGRSPSSPRIRTTR